MGRRKSGGDKKEVARNLGANHWDDRQHGHSTSTSTKEEIVTRKGFRRNRRDRQAHTETIGTTYLQRIGTYNFDDDYNFGKHNFGALGSPRWELHNTWGSAGDLRSELRGRTNVPLEAGLYRGRASWTLGLKGR